MTAENMDPEVLTSPIRTSGQVRQQLKQVLFRHLQKRLKHNFKKVPENCVYNRQESLGDTGQKVHVCRWDSSSNKTDIKNSPRGKICDSRVLGCNMMASACSWWQPLRDKESIKAEFKQLITSGNRGQIAIEYPDVAALMWVLDGVDITQDMLDAEMELEEVVVPEIANPVKVSQEVSN